MRPRIFLLRCYAYAYIYPSIEASRLHTEAGMNAAQITKHGILDMQVCVPSDWTDDIILRWAHENNPCGTENGWVIRRTGDKLLAGDPERQPCAEREGFVHIMLDA